MLRTRPSAGFWHLRARHCAQVLGPRPSRKALGLANSRSVVGLYSVGSGRGGLLQWRSGRSGGWVKGWGGAQLGTSGCRVQGARGAGRARARGLEVELAGRSGRSGGPGRQGAAVVRGLGGGGGARREVQRRAGRGAALVGRFRGGALFPGVASARHLSIGRTWGGVAPCGAPSGCVASPSRRRGSSVCRGRGRKRFSQAFQGFRNMSGSFAKLLLYLMRKANAKSPVNQIRDE